MLLLCDLQKELTVKVDAALQRNKIEFAISWPLLFNEEVMAAQPNRHEAKERGVDSPRNY